MPTPAEQPRFDQPVVDSSGRATQPWMNYWLLLASSASQDGLARRVEILEKQVQELEQEAGGNSFTLLGDLSVAVLGMPTPGGVVLLSLLNDVQAPPATSYYGTDASGTKGWFLIESTVQAAAGELTKTVDANGVSTFGLADLANAGTGSLLAFTRDDKGRVTGTKAATITGTTNQINVANGSAAAGLPTLSLATAVMISLSKADSAVQSVAVGTGMSADITDPRNPSISLAVNLQKLSANTWTPEVIGKDFNLAGTDATEISLGVKNDGGGTAVFHYYTKPLTGLPLANSILGGAGCRPWDGTAWAAHSTAAYHLVASENHTPTATGTNFRIVATPIGSTQANRIINTDFNGDGDIVNSLGLTQRKINATERGRGLEIVRTGNACEVSMVSDLNSTTYQSLFRGYSIGGTIASPGATTSNKGTGYALCGHDGAAYVGAKALVSLLTFDNWSASSTPTIIALETTALGSTARTARWVVKDTGHFYPAADNAYDAGTPSLRVRQYYSVNTSISTSDARLKTAPRDMTDAEVAAFLEIGRLPMVWQWVAKVSAEGDDARLHSGPTVQAAIEVMQKHGLQWRAYAAFCYDEWEDIPEVINEDGDVSAAAVPAGSRYSFRKEELIWWVMRAFIARQDAMEERLNAL